MAYGLCTVVSNSVNSIEFFTTCISVKINVMIFMLFLLLLGEYAIDIKFNDKPIPDSPYKPFVTPPRGEARRCSVSSLQVSPNWSSTPPPPSLPLIWILIAYVRPSFTISRLKSEEFFLVQATTQRVHQGIEWFSQFAGLQWLTVLSMLNRPRGITEGDWHFLLSCYVTLLTEGKIWQVSVLWMWGLAKMRTQLLNTTVT